jgi:ATP/ADP translocase
MREKKMMDTGLNLLTIVQSIMAVAMMIGILALLHWVIENPILKDDEMRKVLEQSRSLREEALQRSRHIAREKSERLYH